MAMASAFSVLPKDIFKAFLCMDSKRSSVCVSWESSFHHSKKDVYPTQVWREMFFSYILSSPDMSEKLPAVLLCRALFGTFLKAYVIDKPI